MASDGMQLQPLNVLNLRNQIEQQVRDAIMRGAFRPGDRLVETAIADQLGVSRAPVREVLSALEREGLVVNVPRRGNFVIDFNDKDIEEIYSLRLLLETGAARRAIGRFSRDDTIQMQALVDRLGRLTAEGGAPEEVVEVDLLFHEELCRAADHGRLYSVWNSMRLQTQLLIGLTSQTQYDHPGQPMEYHQRILNSLQEADLATAQSLLAEHIQDAQRRAGEALKALHAQRA